ncbi:cytochrome C oxidase assembly protein [Salinisphaera sp. Q1T1-3]|nr:cytochrome C oxidase assembly protein [Salinisphaera sp. Q1T1-3]
MLGSIVEGFGFGLALGTRWPYTKNILVLTLRGDPEAAHRVVATAVGLVGVALVIVDPSYEMALGLGMIVATALFGMGVLHVLAGRAPSIVHGIHGLLAYLVFFAYLVPLAYNDIGLGLYLKIIVPTHALLFSIFMGGVVTGGRGFGEPIGAFAPTPRKKPQWIFALHGLAGLLTLGTLGWYAPTYPVAFILCLAQLAIGFIVFQAVNLKPKAPGAVVAFHQAMALLISTAVVLQWQL